MQWFWQFLGLCLPGQMANGTEDAWSTAKSGVGKSLQIYINMNTSRRGLPAQWVMQNKWLHLKKMMYSLQLLQETDDRLNRMGIMGEGSEESRCNEKSKSTENHPVCNAVCLCGWINYRAFIRNNVSVAVNAMLLLREDEKPKGNTSKGLERDCSPEMNQWETDKRPVTDESQSPRSCRGCSALCSHCETTWALGPGWAGAQLVLPPAHASLKAQKKRELLIPDGLHFTAWHFTVNPCHRQTHSQKWSF